MWKALGGTGEIPKDAAAAVREVVDAVNRGASPAEIQDLLKKVRPTLVDNEASAIANKLTDQAKAAAPNKVQQFPDKATARGALSGGQQKAA